MFCNFSLLLIFGILYFPSINGYNAEYSYQNNASVDENQIKSKILAILDHYKQSDPVGVPGAPIPDPMAVPDIQQFLMLGTVTLRNISVHGLSKFRIKNMEMDLQNLKVSTRIQLDGINVTGNFEKAVESFEVILTNVFVIANITMAVKRNGKIRTEDIQIDITFSDMTTRFKNLGAMGQLFQEFVNAAPNLMFDIIKPLLLSEAYTKARDEIDSHIDQIVGSHIFPNSVSPLDMEISKIRQKVRSIECDYFEIPDYRRTFGIFGTLSAELRNIWIVGASSFYLFDKIIVSMTDNKVSLRLPIATQFSGSTDWEISLGNGIISKVGHARFTIQHIKATLVVRQPLDTRQSPEILDLKYNLGNFQVCSNGFGTLDYLLEFSVNIIPNLLRNKIMSAIRNPVKIRIQEYLNQIDVENEIKKGLEKYERAGFEGLDFDFYI